MRIFSLKVQYHATSHAKRSHVFFIDVVAIRKALDRVFDRAWAHVEAIGNLSDRAIGVRLDEIKNSDGRIKCGHD